jgi:Asp-tRNA(Asn)/Glu-tRNA(Gln) amidotransferase A subunit family amidase
LVAGTLGPLGADPKKHAQLKPEAQWEYDQGQGLSGPQVYAASSNRTRFYRHMVSLFERYDLLVLPTAQCLALPGRMDLAARGGRPQDGHLPPLDGGGDLRHAGRVACDERAGGLQRRTACRWACS